MPFARPSNRAALLALFGLTASLPLGACGGPNLASQVAQAPEFAPKDQSKCGVTKSQARPLIVEWPSADRAALESQARRGLVAVHYAGCEMEVLRQCRARGSYGYTGITRKHDRVTIKDADELYANIPAYAAKFEGKLQKSGQLNVDMTIVGTWEAEHPGVSNDDLEGDCDRATHVITALTAGAFEFFAGAEAEASAGVTTVVGAGAGGKSQAQRETLNQDGEKVSCDKASTKDKEPPEGCGALLRVEVVPLSAAKAKSAGAKPDAGSAGNAGSGKTAGGGLGVSVGGAVNVGLGGVASVKLGADGCPEGMAAMGGGTLSMGGKPTTVSPYCIDKTEVTAGAFTECVRAGKCSSEGLSCGPQATYGVSAKKEHPINCVDFAQADAFCRAYDKRVPFEEEWEWAARGGSDGWLYPWGNEPPGSQVCWALAGRSDTCPVGTNVKGDNNVGVHDLVGNVWEWTQTLFDVKNNLRTIRGGSFVDAKADLVVSSKRIPNRSTDRNVNLGFRCVRSR